MMDAEPEAPEPPPDVFRATNDVRLLLPLHSLAEYPDNPKRPISGKYAQGLDASLEHFGVRADLSVWPDPRRPGQYLVLDGNQRLGRLRKLAERKHGIGDVPEDDPDREARLAAIRSAAASETVWCRVLAELDADDAAIFNASFDRNHAAYDEAKVADLHEQLTARREGLDEQLAAKRAELDRRLGKMLRPDKPFAPPPRTPPPARQDGPAPVEPTLDDPEPSPAPDREPADPHLPIGEHSAPAPPARKAAQTLIPFMLGLTAEGHARLEDGLFRCKARGVREHRLVEAVEGLAHALAASGDDGDGLSEAFIEMALNVANDRIAILEGDRDGRE